MLPDAYHTQSPHTSYSVAWIPHGKKFEALKKEYPTV